MLRFLWIAVAVAPLIVSGDIETPPSFVPPVYEAAWSTRAHSTEDFLAMSVKVSVGRGNGSGVLFTREVDGVIKTYVLTAGHVAAQVGMSDDKRATIRLEYRHEGLVVGSAECAAECVAYDDQGGHDLALLEVLQDDFRPLRICAILHSGGVLKVGTEVAHVGCTRRLYNSYSEGVISQTDVEFDGGNVDQTTVMAYPGSSGGGVWVKETGELYGILVQGIGPGINFIVPARHIRAWADRNGAEWIYGTGPSGEPC